MPVLGLDALASAAYGPEAALTVLIPAGALASIYVTSITNWILLVLFAVFLSYRQTIAAYPDGGGSYTVAKQNLGILPGPTSLGSYAGELTIVQARPSLQRAC